MDDEALDLSGLKCPLPALMARKALARAAPGTVITVLSTDPLAVVDIPHMCGEEGHHLESVTHRENQSRFRIRTRPAREAPGSG
jgi:tRNA 2-thiouridine synthesizing protein A